VERDEEHAVVVPEDVLRPVAVVNVPVEDGNALEAELGLCEADGDRDVVEEAEAHRLARERVMTGRPHEREAAALDRLDGTTGGKQRRAVGRLRGGRVGCEPRRPVDGLHHVEIRFRVAAKDLRLGGLPRLAPLRKGFLEHRHPRRGLRMVARRMETGEVLMAYELDRRTASATDSRLAPPAVACPTR
jgi:hypothetical protein